MKKPSPSVNIHASCVALGRAGVLLVGASGTGKSDLALRLIDRGARLVADDRTDLFVAGGRLCSRPPARLAGLIEIRGLGIVRFAHKSSAAIALVVQLGGEGARLPEPRLYAPPAPLAPLMPVPFILLDAFAASAPARIAAALKAFSDPLFRDTVNPK